jgi:hypothetical protein
VKIRVEDGLPYITVSLTYRGQFLQIEKALLDTGSAGTVFSADSVLAIGLQYEMSDSVHRIRGVGGAEFVFSKQVDRLAVDDLEIRDFVVEIGAMDYGFEIDGIVGLDFLLQVGALIDLAHLEIGSGAARA